MTRRPTKPSCNASPTVRKTFELLDKLDIPQAHVADRLNKGPHVLFRWKAGQRMPTIDSVEAMLGSVGYVLAIVPAD